MAKLRIQKYRLPDGTSKINCYNIAVPKKVANEAGITPDDQLTIKPENGRIIVERSKNEDNAR